MCLCVSVCHYVCVCVCPEKPKEGARSPGAALTGGCEPYNVGAGNWTRMLYSKLSCQLSSPQEI